MTQFRKPQAKLIKLDFLHFDGNDVAILKKKKYYMFVF